MKREPVDVEDREELPIVSGLLVRLANTLIGTPADAVLRVVRRIHPRTQERLWFATTGLAFVSMVALSTLDSPSLTGILRGAGAGLIVALLCFFAGARFLLRARAKPPRHAPGAPLVRELNELLEPTLRELREVRRDVIRRVHARSIVRVPIAIAFSVLLWQLNRSDPESPELPVYLLCGALAGELWAAHRLGKQYLRLYKDRVLPQLVARFGDLSYRRPSGEEIETLKSCRILRDCGRIEAEDEIVGTYRSLPLSIIEVSVQTRSRDNDAPLFDGLLVNLGLPRAMTGTTVIGADRGFFGNLIEQVRMEGLQRVRLEDPHFEDRFSVYATDQIQARALLTPAFMERFSDLAAGFGSDLPGAWAENNRLVIALPKRSGRNLFEPPAYWQPAGGRALLELHRDIEAVLKTADAVIELDFWAKGYARATPRPGDALH